MQMDIDRLCLENAMERFLDSGSAQDAFDVYFCYLEMFVGSYGESRMMIEMLSEFEMNGSSVLMKHRDHYSHSVYVFAIGLAIYEANSAYREVYQKYYGFFDEKEAAHHFLKFWGLSSLFHDIGYPFELPFEQVESYFEVRGEKRKNNPFLSYRGMEKFIKESKSGFDFASVSSHSRVVNANRLQVHALAYNIFNWFRRLALSSNMRKQRIDTVRLKLLKIAAKAVHSARYITFKLCSSCPYKNEFYETFSNISKLNVQLE